MSKNLLLAIPTPDKEIADLCKDGIVFYSSGYNDLAQALDECESFKRGRAVSKGDDIDIQFAKLSAEDLKACKSELQELVETFELKLKGIKAICPSANDDSWGNAVNNTIEAMQRIRELEKVIAQIDLLVGIAEANESAIWAYLGA